MTHNFPTGIPVLADVMVCRGSAFDVEEEPTAVAMPYEDLVRQHIVRSTYTGLKTPQ